MFCTTNFSRKQPRPTTSTARPSATLVTTTHNNHDKYLSILQSLLQPLHTMACVKKDAGDGHSFEDIVQMQEISPNIYQSALLGKEAVPNQKMNYGGWTMAIALKASNLTVDPKYHPYSMTGSFLGPSSPHKPLIAKVRILRSTRSFQTRFVEISQTQDNGDSRICLTFTADYQAQEAGTVLEYSAPPGLNYSKPDDCPTIAGYIDEYASKGLITEDEAARSRNFRYFFANYFVQKDCPESAFAQQLLILNKMFPGAAGVQADKKITDKKSGCWFKNVRPLSTINQAPGLAFVMDGCLPIGMLLSRTSILC